MVPPTRQINEVIGQCNALADASSMLDELGLEEGNAEVESAKTAFDDFSGWLSAELQPLLLTKMLWAVNVMPVSRSFSSAILLTSMRLMSGDCIVCRKFTLSS